MCHPQFLQPFQAGGFVAGIVRFADAEQVRSEAGGKGPAELGLAGTRRAVQQDVDAGGAGFQCALQELADVPAIRTQIVEVGPGELTWDRVAEQHARHLQVAVVRGAGQPQQPFHQLQVVVAVDRDQAGPRQGSPGGEALAHAVGGYAEHCAQHRVAQVEDVHRRAPVDLVQQRLDDRTGVVPDQHFQDGDVAARQVGYLGQPPEMARREVLARAPRPLAQVPKRLAQGRARPIDALHVLVPLEQVRVLDDPVEDAVGLGDVPQAGARGPCDEVEQVGKDQVPLVGVQE